ncbi:hypothetical protein B4168_4170 [Anoxybacillus flavithermus]|nr:hypothetical protein B4168_4170 [Anoxybacillus flavithermus]OAO87286.1 hypothetical protein GT23_1335 [Parageobacillus thermoglucosidasius]
MNLDHWKTKPFFVIFFLYNFWDLILHVRGKIKISVQQHQT